MDAVKYLKTVARICKSHKISCNSCPIYKAMGNTTGTLCDNAGALVDTVEAVEQWAKDHPIRTRKSVFLERYPNATIDTAGNIGICPAAIEGKNCNDICSGTGCRGCRSNYWNQEVPDESKG